MNFKDWYDQCHRRIKQNNVKKASDEELKRHVVLRLLEIMHSLGVSGHEAEAMRNGETK